MGEDAHASMHDIEVYKQQLAEIADDAARGAIGADDAAAARAEVSRRILKAGAEASAAVPRQSGKSARIIASAVALSIPVVAWTVYSLTGAQGRTDEPFLARLNAPAGQASIEVLIAKTELHLRQHPDDGKGWAVIGPIYLRTGQYQKALSAFETAATLLGDNMQFELGKGEAHAGLNDGRIGPDAIAAFKRAAELAPEDPQPRIYLATEIAQRGDYAAAKSAFEAILKGAPAGAEWRPVVEQTIAQLDAAIKNPPSATPGPSAQDVQNAAGMSEQDRTSMIEGMVAKLDARLSENPGDKDGWLRLIRSYAMLQKPEKAQDALARARQGLKTDQAALSEIKAMAVQLGLEKS